MNKLLPKIIFYGLIIGVAVAGTVLFLRSQPVDNQQLTTSNQQPSCIITIDGQKYDVESLRFTHTGGDIFQCGTDMSAAFHQKHGDRLQMIQRYLVQ